MSTMQNRIDSVEHLLNESLGRRSQDSRPVLSPVPSPRDVGRRPLRGFGRIETRQVMPDPAQPRTEFDPEAITVLADNLKAKGQLHPIHVRWSEEFGCWLIISGERRWRAACEAKLSTVDCFFHEQPLSPGEVLELQLIENLLREDLRPLEEAQAFQSLMELNGWNGKQVAEALRLPPSKVSRSLALLDLPADIQQRVESGDIPARTAYEISRLTDDTTKRELAQASVEGRLTNATAAQAVRTRPTRRPSKPQTVSQTFIAENQCRLVITAPRTATYHDLESALQQALEEVRLRIDNNVRL